MIHGFARHLESTGHHPTGRISSNNRTPKRRRNKTACRSQATYPAGDRVSHLDSIIRGFVRGLPLRSLSIFIRNYSRQIKWWLVSVGGDSSPKNILARRLPWDISWNASSWQCLETFNKGTQWLPSIRTLQGQHGSVPAAVAVVSRGPIFVEWLSNNFCDFCTHARIDVGIATSGSMALRDILPASSVTTRKIQNPCYITRLLSFLPSHNLPANGFPCTCPFKSRAR